MVSSSVMIIAECARSDCSPFHSAPTHDKLCCTDDLCNNGTYVPDESAENPCHSYTCTSGWDCLQAGILDGYSRTCPSDARYGCFVHKSQGGSTTSVRAGCSKHTCQSVYAEVGPNKNEYTCCTGNLCNDGNKREEENKNTSENNISGNNSGLRHVTSRNVLVTIYIIFITIINTI